MFPKNTHVIVIDSATTFAGRTGFVKSYQLGKVVLSEEPLNGQRGKQNLFSVNPEEVREFGTE